jgi:F0F1-type ATP synthase assembly protein I
LKKNDRMQQVMNLTLAGVAGTAGCLTLVIVVAAVLGGLWLDARFDTRPTMTITLVLVSIPISIGAMLVLVRLATSKIKTNLDAAKKQGHSEEDGLGRNS